MNVKNILNYLLYLSIDDNNRSGHQRNTSGPHPHPNGTDEAVIASGVDHIRGNEDVVNDTGGGVGSDLPFQASHSKGSFFEHRRRYTATFGEDVLAYPDYAPATVFALPHHTNELPPVPEYK